MWHFGTWFSRHGGVGVTAGLDDLRGLFQPQWFYDNKSYKHSNMVTWKIILKLWSASAAFKSINLFWERSWMGKTKNQSPSPEDSKYLQLTLRLRCHLQQHWALSGTVPVLSHHSKDINCFWHQVLDRHLRLSRMTGIFNTLPWGKTRFGHRITA